MPEKLIAGRKPMLVAALIRFASAFAEAAPTPAPLTTTTNIGGLSWGPSNSVIYDDDEVIDDYTHAYVISAASNVEIELKGLTVSCSISPYNQYVPHLDYERMVADRQEIVNAARASGLVNIPNPVRGTEGHLVKPWSGLVHDTVPQVTAGSNLIVTEARKTTAQLPLIVIVGCQLSTVASAYLQAPDIADKVVVLWSDAIYSSPTALSGYNAWADGWAATIALQKLRLVIWNADPQTYANIQKSYLQTLPGSSPFKMFIVNQHHPTNGLPFPWTVEPGAFSIRRSDYSGQFQRVAYTGMTTKNGHEVPTFAVSATGPARIVTDANVTIGTTEWKRAVEKALMTATFVIAEITRGSGVTIVEWHCVPGETYQVEKCDLLGGTWGPLGNQITAGSGQLTLSINDSSNGITRFYRVRLVN